MKQLAIALALLAGIAFANPAAENTTTEPAPAGPTIKIEAKGADLRDVIHDLFKQANADYVMEQGVRGTVFLSLNNVTLEKALEVLTITANLDITEIEGLYRVRVAPPKPKPIEIKVPEGPVDYLAKNVTVTVDKQTLEAIAKLLSDQTGAKISIDPSVPAYRVSMAIRNKSLKHALNALSSAAPLTYVSNPDRSITLKPRAASVETKKTIQPAPAPKSRGCLKCGETLKDHWKWCPACGRYLTVRG